jgi:hypothetical protein
MQDTAIPKKMLYGKLYVYATRRRERPKTRWLDDVSTDLRKMGISEWRGRARDREVWRHIGKEVKAHPGLYRYRRRRRRRVFPIIQTFFTQFMHTECSFKCSKVPLSIYIIRSLFNCAVISVQSIPVAAWS